MLGYPLILLVLVEKCHIIDLKGCWEARIVPQERTLRAHNRVDLPHRLHDLQVVVVQLSGHQINVPHSEVGMEEDDSFHGELG